MQSPAIIGNQQRRNNQSFGATIGNQANDQSALTNNRKTPNQIDEPDQPQQQQVDYNQNQRGPDSSSSFVPQRREQIRQPQIAQQQQQQQIDSTTTSTTTTYSPQQTTSSSTIPTTTTTGQQLQRDYPTSPASKVSISQKIFV